MVVVKPNGENRDFYFDGFFFVFFSVAFAFTNMVNTNIAKENNRKNGD